MAPDYFDFVGRGSVAAETEEGVDEEEYDQGAADRAEDYAGYDARLGAIVEAAVGGGDGNDVLAFGEERRGCCGCC